MNSLNDQLRQIALEAFESLCRIFPLMEDEAGKEHKSMEKCIAVDFSGPIHGTFILGYNGHLDRVIAEAMLESATSAQEQEDALKEMANVICGNILPYIAGPESLFKLSPPRREPFLPPNGSSQAEIAQTRINFAEGSAHLTIYRHSG